MVPVSTRHPTKAQLTSVTDAAGTTSFTYNVAGQLATLDDPLSSTGLSTYDYQGSTGANTGRLERRVDTQANLRWNLTYEAATGRLDVQTITTNAQTPAPVASFDLSYTASGNVKTKASTVFSNASNTTWIYDYDGASRLIQAKGKNASGIDTTWDYTYDAGGNRTRAKESVTSSGSVVADWTTTFDAAGLATSATNAVGGESVSYGYDLAGITLTSEDSTTNANDRGSTYDAFGRLTCAKTGATTCGTTAAATRVTYALDAFDRTSQRTLNKTATTNTYRGTTESLVKAGTTTYAQGATGSPLGQKVGTAAASYFLADPHGDTVGIVSTTATNQGTTAFDPFGRVLGVSGTQVTFGFQSDVTDALTKAVDMGTRWYAPSRGAFSSRDVLFGDPMSPVSMNQWGYGGANPITMHDPTGMLPIAGNESTQEDANRYSEGSSSSTSWGSAASEPDPVVPPVTAPSFDHAIDIYQWFWMHEAFGNVMDWDNLDAALDASDEFDVDPHLLVTLMIREGFGREFGDKEWRGGAAFFEWGLVVGGPWVGRNNPSIGIMQMQYETFRATQANHPGSFAGFSTDPRREFYRRLSDERTAIRYAAAHIADIGAETGVSDPAVLAGIYNSGIGVYEADFVPDGEYVGSAQNYVDMVNEPGGLYSQVRLLF